MANSTSSERSPLLGHSEDESSIEQAQGPAQNGDAVSIVPSTKEPYNARLALIMGSIWVRGLANFNLCMLKFFR